MRRFEKKYVVIFSVGKQFETLRLFADDPDEAKDLAISVYMDYVKAGFIKDFVYIGLKELEENEQ